KAYRVQLKLCTVIAPGSTGTLGGQTFSYSIWVDGSTTAQKFTSQGPYPSCSGLMLNVPIIDPTTGKPASIKVKQTSYTPSSVTVDNPPMQTTAASITFTPAVGIATVTFTNS